MRRFLALALLVLLMGHAPIQESLPVRYYDIWMCGKTTGPPPTPGDLRRSADLVIHVRIDAQSAFVDEQFVTTYRSPHFDTPDEELERTVYTTHEATVLALVKAHPNAVVEGASERFIQRGGPMLHTEQKLIERVNGFDVLPVGSEWVLFLSWNPHLGVFSLYNQEHALPVRNGKVATEGYGWHTEFHGLPAEEFMEALRR